MAKKKHSIKELEKKMSPEKLKKLKTHYGMGATGEIGVADNWKPKTKKKNVENMSKDYINNCSERRKKGGKG